MTELFTPNTNGQPTLETPVDVLEYAKTKFKNAEGELDVEKLAKGKYDADLTIAQREQELASLREELTTRRNMEQLLEDLKTRTNEGPEAGTPSPAAQPEGVKPLTDDDLKAKMAEFVNEQEQKKALQANVAFVRDELIKSFGPSFEQKVMARANELGVNRQFLESMAATQPRAFLELVGAPKPQVDPNAGIAPRTSVASLPPQAGERNYAYYQKIKVSNEREYWSPRVQLEMHRQAAKLGERFYSK